MYGWAYGNSAKDCPKKESQPWSDFSKMEDECMRDAEVGWHSEDADPFAAIRSNRNTKLDNQQKV